MTSRQQAAVDHRGSNVLVEAVPGSGKTRVIVERCAALLREGIAPSEVLLLTFSRKAVGELRQRVTQTVGAQAQPEIRTFHGFAARLLGEAARSGTSSRLLSEPAERDLFSMIVSTATLPTIPAPVASGIFFREAAATLVDDLNRSKQEAITQLEARATPRLQDLLTLAYRQREQRKLLGVADFDDLIARVVQEAAETDSMIAEILRTRYKHVLVDEFQDTDPLQLALLGKFTSEIFAVGDDAQAIYGFRGAARNAMTVAQQRLSMTTLMLDESFRCPMEICALAASVWPTPIPLRSKVSELATVTFRRAASYHDEAAYIAMEVATEIERGTPATKIAVLLRSAEPLASLVEKHIRSQGIPVARRGGQTVLSDSAVDALCAGLGALADAGDPDAWLRLFAHPAFGLDRLRTRLMLHKLKPRTVNDALALLSGLATDERSPAARLASAISAAQTKWNENEPVRAARLFATHSDLLAYVISGGEDTARQSAANISAFLEGFADVFDLRKRQGLHDDSAALLSTFLENSADWRSGNDSLDSSGVAVLTIHAAKGLEFEFVVIADAVETHFPQVWRADPLASSTEVELARNCKVDLGTRQDEHDTEERSLWYVAVTRSRRSLLVTWSENDSDGTPLRPSRFIPLEARTEQSNAASFRGPLEYKSAPALKERQEPSPASFRRPVRTSAMETWLTCRRKFYYGTLLRIESEARGFSAKLGSLVSETAARFHESAKDFRNVAAGAHSSWSTTLQMLAREVLASEKFDGFDSPLETLAALRSADRLLDRYARSLETAARAEGGAFEVVGVEEPVSYEIEGIKFSGRIDRVDRLADGLLVLIDLKTGKMRTKPMTEAFPKLEALAANGDLWTGKGITANPQLALYRHAKPEANALEYLYLGSESGANKFSDKATIDRLETSQTEPIKSIDKVLHDTFFEPWNAGTITSVVSTKNPRTCRTCDFQAVCPGYLEDDD